MGGAIASLVSLSIDSSHWRWIFILGGLAPLVLVPIMQATLRDSPQFDRSSRADEKLTAAAGVEPSRGSFRAIFGDGRVTATVLLWVSFFLGLLTLYLLLSWLPTLLTSNGLSKAEAAGAQIAFNVGGAIAALSIGQLLEGRWRVPSVLLVFLAMPVLIFALAHSANEALPTIVGVVFFLGCAVLAAQAFLYAEAPTRYPASIRGIGIGAAVAAGRLGSIAGPKLGGLLKAAGHSSSELLFDILPLVLAGSAVAIALLFYRTRSQTRKS
jgi:AAHS family 3-hydroxyphenylpropionic acid transporter